MTGYVGQLVGQQGVFATAINQQALMMKEKDRVNIALLNGLDRVMARQTHISDSVVGTIVQKVVGGTFELTGGTPLLPGLATLDAPEAGVAASTAGFVGSGVSMPPAAAVAVPDPGSQAGVQAPATVPTAASNLAAPTMPSSAQQIGSAPLQYQQQLPQLAQPVTGMLPPPPGPNIWPGPPGSQAFGQLPYAPQQGHPQ